MIYLDNAATSWPKPPQVIEAMAEYLQNAGGNPGRSAHALSIAAGRSLYDTRELLATLFHAPDPLRIVFTLNVTQALNLALRGLLRPGDRVVTSGVEHNAIMRPLRALEREGVELVVVPCAPDTLLDPAELARAVTPGTRMVALMHASNVTGAIQPVAEAARLAHAAGALLLVDAAQSAGAVPIDVQDMDIDLLGFTGHKGLQGPPGTGGLVIGPRVDVHAMQPLERGGTGSDSEFEVQPEHLPDKFESGTPNGVGIAGLGAAVRYLLDRGVENIRRHEIGLTRQLVEGLIAIPRVRVYGPRDVTRRTATVSFTIDGLRVSEVGLWLDEERQILARVGLHCAPAAHKTLGTFPEGAVRLSAGPMTTADEIDAALAAVKAVAAQ
ncbi:MAG: aminotransferase class V-fold PLP-dependent enzyme [Anaerolineae bacterium]